MKTTAEQRAALLKDARCVFFVSDGSRAPERMKRVLDAMPDLLDDLDEALAAGFAARLLADESAKVGELIEEHAALAAKLAKVRAIHTRDVAGIYRGTWAHCRECIDSWPCPTIRALDGSE